MAIDDFMINPSGNNVPQIPIVNVEPTPPAQFFAGQLVATAGAENAGQKYWDSAQLYNTLSAVAGTFVDSMKGTDKILSTIERNKQIEAAKGNEDLQAELNNSKLDTLYSSGNITPKSQFPSAAEIQAVTEAGRISPGAVNDPISYLRGDLEDTESQATEAAAYNNNDMRKIAGLPTVMGLIEEAGSPSPLAGGTPEEQSNYIEKNLPKGPEETDREAIITHFKPYVLEFIKRSDEAGNAHKERNKDASQAQKNDSHTRLDNHLKNADITSIFNDMKKRMRGSFTPTQEYEIIEAVLGPLASRGHTMAHNVIDGHHKKASEFESNEVLFEYGTILKDQLDELSEFQKAHLNAEQNGTDVDTETKHLSTEQKQVYASLMDTLGPNPTYLQFSTLLGNNLHGSPKDLKELVGKSITPEAYNDYVRKYDTSMRTAHDNYRTGKRAEQQFQSIRQGAAIIDSLATGTVTDPVTKNLTAQTVDGLSVLFGNSEVTTVIRQHAIGALVANRTQSGGSGDPVGIMGSLLDNERFLIGMLYSFDPHINIKDLNVVERKEAARQKLEALRKEHNYKPGEENKGLALALYNDTSSMWAQAKATPFPHDIPVTTEMFNTIAEDLGVPKDQLSQELGFRHAVSTVLGPLARSPGIQIPSGWTQEKEDGFKAWATSVGAEAMIYGDTDRFREAWYQAKEAAGQEEGITEDSVNKILASPMYKSYSMDQKAAMVNKINALVGPGPDGNPQITIEEDGTIAYNGDYEEYDLIGTLIGAPSEKKSNTIMHERNGPYDIKLRNTAYANTYSILSTLQKGVLSTAKTLAKEAPDSRRGFMSKTSGAKADLSSVDIGALITDRSQLAANTSKASIELYTNTSATLMSSTAFQVDTDDGGPGKINALQSQVGYTTPEIKTEVQKTVATNIAEYHATKEIPKILSTDFSISETGEVTITRSGWAANEALRTIVADAAANRKNLPTNTNKTIQNAFDTIWSNKPVEEKLAQYVFLTTIADAYTSTTQATATQMSLPGITDLAEGPYRTAMRRLVLDIAIKKQAPDVDSEDILGYVYNSEFGGAPENTKIGANTLQPNIPFLQGITPDYFDRFNRFAKEEPPTTLKRSQSGTEYVRYAQLNTVDTSDTASVSAAVKPFEAISNLLGIPGYSDRLLLITNPDDSTTKLLTITSATNIGLGNEDGQHLNIGAINEHAINLYVTQVLNSTNLNPAQIEYLLLRLKDKKTIPAGLLYELTGGRTAKMTSETPILSMRMIDGGEEGGITVRSNMDNYPSEHPDVRFKYNIAPLHGFRYKFTTGGPRSNPHPVITRTKYPDIPIEAATDTVYRDTLLKTSLAGLSDETKGWYRDNIKRVMDAFAGAPLKVDEKTLIDAWDSGKTEHSLLVTLNSILEKVTVEEGTYKQGLRMNTKHGLFTKQQDGGYGFKLDNEESSFLLYPSGASSTNELDVLVGEILAHDEKEAK